jgi:uncharacterized membrane protein YjjP (DUF1212 family)
MSEKQRHQMGPTVSLIVALACALIFGIVVLAGGDWIPGTIIVVASGVGLARQVPIIQRRRSHGSSGMPTRPRS